MKKLRKKRFYILEKASGSQRPKSLGFAILKKTADRISTLDRRLKGDGNSNKSHFLILLNPVDKTHT